jgi:hypothetical protein
MNNSIFDHRAIGKEIARLLSLEAEKRGVTRTVIAEKTWMFKPTISDFLNGVRATKWDKYKQIAKAIGMSDREYDQLAYEAKRAVFKKEVWDESVWEENTPVTLEMALSSRFGNNTKAIEEVLKFAEYVEQKEGGKM